MDLSSLKTNAAVVETGDWVDNIPDMGDLRLKVRGRGNAKWRRLEQQMANAVEKGKRLKGRLAPEEQDRIIGICIRDTALIDWDNLKDGDQAIPYSKEMATTLLTEPQFRAFFDACVWACSVVGDDAAAGHEANIKN